MREWMQPDGWQRSYETFARERQEMLWGIGVRARSGGIAMGLEDFLPSFPGEIGGMGAMGGGGVDFKAMPLVDSALGAGWVVGQLGVADVAAEVQNGRGGVEWGEQGDWSGPPIFSGGFCELVADDEGHEGGRGEWRCYSCAAINPAAIKLGECYVCTGGGFGTGGADGSARGPEAGSDESGQDARHGVELGTEQEAGGKGLPIGGFVAPKPRPRAQAWVQPLDEMGWGEEGETGRDETGGDEMGRGGMGQDGMGQQVVSCRGRAGFYLCGQVLCSGCVARCHECEGHDIHREAMGGAESVDGVLVGEGVQEVTVGLEAEQEVEEGDGEQA
jgi:hypothetical protein